MNEDCEERSMPSKSTALELESQGIESISPLILTPPPTPTEGIGMLTFSSSNESKTALQSDSNIEGYHNDVSNSCDTNNCFSIPMCYTDVKAALQSKGNNFTALRTAENDFTGGEDRLSSFRLSTCERYVVFIKYMS